MIRKALRKGFLLGIGVARLSSKKVKKELLSFLRQNRINKKEADTFTRAFLKKAAMEKTKYEAFLKKESGAAAKKAKALYSKESAKLKKRVKQLKRKKR